VIVTRNVDLSNRNRFLGPLGVRGRAGDLRGTQPATSPCVVILGGCGHRPRRGDRHRRDHDLGPRARSIGRHARHAVFNVIRGARWRAGPAAKSGQKNSSACTDTFNRARLRPKGARRALPGHHSRFVCVIAAGPTACGTFRFRGATSQRIGSNPRAGAPGPAFQVGLASSRRSRISGRDRAGFRGRALGLFGSVRLDRRHRLTSSRSSRPSSVGGVAIFGGAAAGVLGARRRLSCSNTISRGASLGRDQTSRSYLGQAHSTGAMLVIAGISRSTPDQPAASRPALADTGGAPVSDTGRRGATPPVRSLQRLMPLGERRFVCS